jgi:2-polyprenyl-6-methoxyphenol hydroxylase-like FAD-dependent oxidoreductase
MSPQLGQGANLALIDAMKLVDALERHPADVPAALDSYTRDRWWRVAFYQAQSRILTPVFASRSEALRVLRDSLMNHGCHAPVLRRFVHAVLCGAQSPNLLTPLGTIPEDEFLGFLDGIHADSPGP